MKRIMLILSVLMLAAGTTEMQAQWIKKLGKKAAESAKRATERNVEKKVEKTVDKAFDGAEDAVKGEGKNKDTKTADPTSAANPDAEGQAIAQDGGQQSGQSLEMTYAKSDFVPGDEIIFEDLMDGEQLGEFPSMWDLMKGNAEIAAINGENCIMFGDGGAGSGSGELAPLMKDMNSYLPEEYTIELDFWLPSGGSAYYYIFRLNDASKKRDNKMYFRIDFEKNNVYAVSWSYIATSGGNITGEQESKLELDTWHHLAMSFNKRAFKAYIDGVRIANIPNMTTADNFTMFAGRNSSIVTLATRNVRIAKGAVPLYDRMLSDGKFITYGITFDVGKSTIKPESMGEINRIVTLMKKKPDLKFSVEGHTDSTGNAASNQTLSEA
ncbi:LamG-like jellyroll fold domain-containing protein, partial [Parabacteroides gordonii]|uniref:OmpA family protein n=1 Tax=Parabacteroides gordonii TaxID=574930 RepID=UPI0026EEFE9F